MLKLGHPPQICEILDHPLKINSHDGPTKGTATMNTGTGQSKQKSNCNSYTPCNKFLTDNQYRIECASCSVIQSCHVVVYKLKKQPNSFDANIMSLTPCKKNTHF